MKHILNLLISIKCRLTDRNVKHAAWMTSGLLTSSRKKVKLHNKKLNKPTETNIWNYKTYETF